MKHSYSKKGFTLLEVLVAMLVFSIGMLGLTSMYVVRVKNDNYSKKMVIADNIALELMEEVKSVPYYIAANGVTNTVCTLASPDDNVVDCLRPDNLDSSTPAAPYNKLASDVSYLQVNGIWVLRTVTMLADNPQNNMKKITVNVKWKEDQNAQTIHNVTYITMRDRGVK